MSIPTVQDLIYTPSLRVLYQICPTCQGGRGALEPIIDEAHTNDNNEAYTIVNCPQCKGAKILKRDQA